MIRSARTAAVLLALCAAVTATTTASSTAATPSLQSDLLRVTYDNGHGLVVDRTLECHPAGGSLPGAAQACGRLDALGGPVGAAPQREMCSMLYGGPETARVTGMWRGKQVDESYSRSNGCQTARWDRMAPVLPRISPDGNPEDAPVSVPKTPAPAPAPVHARPGARALPPTAG